MSTTALKKPSPDVAAKSTGSPVAADGFAFDESPGAVTEKELLNLELNASNTQNKGLLLLFNIYNQYCSGQYQSAHEKINTLLEKFQQSTESQFFKDCGITFFSREGKHYLRPAEVWQPDEWSTVYVNVLKFYEGKKVLSAGCGSGWVEIEGIKTHRPKEVTTTDIRPEAVLTTRINAFWHGVQGHIKAYVSDGFDALTQEFQSRDGRQSFDISHFCAPQVFRPEDLVKLKSGAEDFTDLQADETGDYFKPDGEDIYGFSLNKRLIRQSREMGVKHIFANMALRLPESILQAACFGPVGTFGQLVGVKRVEMHPGTSLDHVLWLERDHSTPTVFSIEPPTRGTQITAEQANTRLSQSPSLPVYHDVGLYILTDTPVTSLMTYMELKNITDIPYDDIPGALPVREVASRAFGEVYSVDDVTICPDSKQAWRNIETLYNRPLLAFGCIDKLLCQLDSGCLNSQVIKVSLLQQSDLINLPLLFTASWSCGVTLFMEIPHSVSGTELFEELRHYMEKQTIIPSNIHLVWTLCPPGDQEKTIFLSKNYQFKVAFDAAVELTWSRVSLLAQFNLLHHLNDFQMIPSLKKQVVNNLPAPQADFQAHKQFQSTVLEASRQGQAPRVPLDYGANRVDEKSSIAKKWGIPCLLNHIKSHGLKAKQSDSHLTFQNFFESRFHLSDGEILTANGVSDAFNGIALYTKKANKSIAFPQPGYGEFLENAQSLLGIDTYILSNNTEGKLTPVVIQSYLEQYPDGIVYWNMPYPNPTGAAYSRQEITDLLIMLNKYPQAAVFIDAVFMDTGELLRENFDLSAIKIPYIIATGLSKSIGGPGCRAAVCLVSDKDMAISLMEDLSIPSTADKIIAHLYYDAILKNDSELMFHMKQQSLLLQEKRQFVMGQFGRIGMKPVASPKGGLFVALSCSSLYGKVFSDPTTKGQQFQLNEKTLGMAFESCGLRINTPDWTGHKSIVRVVIAEPYDLLNNIPSCIDLFQKCCDQ